jgi:hypothetical protein
MRNITGITPVAGYIKAISTEYIPTKLYLLASESEINISATTIWDAGLAVWDGNTSIWS